jgi:hypothetical protein
MTEDQAKTTRCCDPNGCGEVRDDNRGSPDNAPRYCISSACMAWRWIPKAGTDENAQPNYYAGQWQGYCGLAGKP